MNWKIVCSMCVALGLMAGCGASQKSAESAPPAAEATGGTRSMKEDPAMPPSAAPAPGTTPQAIVMPEKKDR